MAFWLLALVTLLPSLGFSREGDFDLCQKYSVGVQKVDQLGPGTLLVVSREEPLIHDADGIQLAFELAELDAKAKLLGHKKSDSLAGVKKLFSCMREGYAYVGIAWSRDSDAKAEFLKKSKLGLTKWRQQHTPLSYIQ